MNSKKKAKNLQFIQHRSNKEIIKYKLQHWDIQNIGDNL